MTRHGTILILLTVFAPTPCGSLQVSTAGTAGTAHKVHHGLSAGGSSGSGSRSVDSGGQTPFIIGVAGATASGKTSLVTELVRLLDAEGRVASVTQDCFYKNLSPEEREQAYQSNYNFDHPNAFDWKHTRDVLHCLRDGAPSVAIPTYDFVTHSRLGPDHDTTVRAPEIVIFEGILAMHDPEVRELFDLKIFIDTDADVRLARRIMRDMEERGRDLAGILEQYQRFVKPATESFVIPTKAHADIVIPRGADNVVAIEMLAQHINGVLVQRELAAEVKGRLG